jgi:hypothetical protein
MQAGDCVDCYAEHRGIWATGNIIDVRADLHPGTPFLVEFVERAGNGEKPRTWAARHQLLLNAKGAHMPESKREAREQHAAAGIGPDVKPDVKTEAQVRKDRPVARGCLDYFPDALMVVAEVSRLGNEQHNAGQPMHWAYGKSMDHADCCVRHLADRGTDDSDGAPHSGKAAWRALANLQTELERKDPELHARRQAQREAAARGER